MVEKSLAGGFLIAQNRALLDVLGFELIAGAVISNLALSHCSSPFLLGLAPVWWVPCSVVLCLGLIAFKAGIHHFCLGRSSFVEWQSIEFSSSISPFFWVENVS